MKNLALPTCAVLAAAVVNGVFAIDLDVDSRDSVKSAASIIAAELILYYDPEAITLLPEPHNWWEAGAMFSTLVDYWALTGDETHVPSTQYGLFSQIGHEKNYMGMVQNVIANDDQAVWALAAMGAAEYGFPYPEDGDEEWVTYAKNAFDNLALRWDNETCGGGLRWLVFSFDKGYDYKNVHSNGAFFQLAARLARYYSQDDGEYAEWAGKVWDWLVEVEFVTEDFNVLDGAHTTHSCTDVNPLQWTINAGFLIEGIANMYNVTNGDKIWEDRLSGLLDRTTKIFFKKDTNIMWEAACEHIGTCDPGLTMFKRFLARAVSTATVLAPFTRDSVMPHLTASAKAAALQCSGGKSKTTCGLQWTEEEEYDGEKGVGVQMSALQVIQGLLVEDAEMPTPTSSPSSPSSSSSPPRHGGEEGGSVTPTDEPSGTPTNAAALTAGVGYQKTIPLLVFFAVVLV